MRFLNSKKLTVKFLSRTCSLDQTLFRFKSELLLGVILKFTAAAVKSRTPRFVLFLETRIVFYV